LFSAHDAFPNARTLAHDLNSTLAERRFAAAILPRAEYR
jgi:hypothetical protein